MTNSSCSRTCFALFEILHIRDGRPPIPTAEQKFVAEVHPIQVLRISTLYSRFIRSESRFSKQMMFVSIKKSYRNVLA